MQLTQREPTNIDANWLHASFREERIISNVQTREHSRLSNPNSTCWRVSAGLPDGFRQRRKRMSATHSSRHSPVRATRFGLSTASRDILSSNCGVPMVKTKRTSGLSAHKPTIPVGTSTATAGRLITDTILVSSSCLVRIIPFQQQK